MASFYGGFARESPPAPQKGGSGHGIQARPRRPPPVLAASCWTARPLQWLPPGISGDVFFFRRAFCRPPMGSHVDPVGGGRHEMARGGDTMESLLDFFRSVNFDAGVLPWAGLIVGVLIAVAEATE